MKTFDEILATAKLLSEEDQLLLVELLLQSVYTMEGEVRDAWEQELARRIHDIDSGAVTLIPAEQVFEEARRLLRS